MAPAGFCLFPVQSNRNKLETGLSSARVNSEICLSALWAEPYGCAIEPEAGKDRKRGTRNNTETEGEVIGEGSGIKWIKGGRERKSE